mmetsp:Transcript_3527/g.6448  ORF Transcript_3527/g.6448 Transcript_3527/m.6448 type:complete len:80 (-) Transcript_3527:3-242(-)
MRKKRNVPRGQPKMNPLQKISVALRVRYASRKGRMKKDPSARFRRLPFSMHREIRREKEQGIEVHYETMERKPELSPGL